MAAPERTGRSPLEAALAPARRHALGAYFTHPADVARLVRPTLVVPWRARIDAARTPAELAALHARLRAFRVLDPACGDGVFLVAAGRALRRLEARLLARWAALPGTRRVPPPGTGPWQLLGIDLQAAAVEAARAALWREHAAAGGRPGPAGGAEACFTVGDALLDEGGRERAWPQADAIVGNPPFLGAKRLAPERGAGYVRALRLALPQVPALADYCVYWIDKAHRHLPRCTREDPVTGRAGLVLTGNVRAGRSRAGGLDRVVADGTIVEAVDNLPWPGDARVHVALVSWVKTQDPALLPRRRRLWSVPPGRGAGSRRLAARAPAHIGSALTGRAAGGVLPLPCNQRPKRCFQGKIPGYAGFLLDAAAAARLRADSGEVVRPYLTGRELLDPFRIRRWIVDLEDRGEAAAARFPAALDHLRAAVRPEVEAALARAERAGSGMAAARRAHLARWWQLWNRRDALAAALRALPRYLACSRVARRPILAFVASGVVPSDLVQVFAFADDYAFGVLQGDLHAAWVRARASRLKVERDLRYGVREVFETFPWPQGRTFDGPPHAAVEVVAEAGRALRAARAAALARQGGGGLRDLYCALERPGPHPVKRAQAALDRAVRAAYGIQRGDGVEELAALNAAVVARLARGAPVTAPGIPPGFPRPERLVSADALGRG